MRDLDQFDLQKFSMLCKGINLYMNYKGTNNVTYAKFCALSDFEFSKSCI